VTCVAPSPHDPHVLATGSYDDVVRLWDARAARKPLTVASVSLGGGSWRARWHPRARRLAVAAMDGGAVVLDWDGEERFCHGASGPRNDGGGETLGPGDEDGGDDRDGTLSEDRSSTIASSGLRVSCAYDGHASIAYGADWGWRGAGEGSYSAPDVVVSCSFYDKGLHVWSPAP
jgi:diphthamide biosynthesis protein 7